MTETEKPKGIPGNIIWVPIAEAPDWMKAPRVEILVWCGTPEKGQPVCGHYTNDLLDAERREDGLVLDFHWPGMGEPTFIASINPPRAGA